MKQYVQFQCSGEDAEILPESLVRQAGGSFRDAQSKAGAMAAVAKVLKQERGDVLAQVPFCVSIEAEALGAPVTIYDNPMPPSLGTYPCNSLEDALSLPDIDFSEGRIREVLQAVHLLAAQGEKVSLRVEGPFTVLAMLMSVTEICRIFCRDSMALLPVVDKLAADAASYARLGMEAGARVISYADPSGDPEILGPEVYELCAYGSSLVMQRTEPLFREGVMHICGRTSFLLQQNGIVEAVPTGIRAKSYGEAVLAAAGDPGIRFIGHGCMQQTTEDFCPPLIQLVPTGQRS